MDSGVSVALLALKKEFLSLDQLIACFHRWVEQPQLAFDAILIECDALTKTQRTALERSLGMGKKDGVGDWEKLINDQIVVIPALRALMMLGKKLNAPERIREILEDGLAHLLLKKAAKPAKNATLGKTKPEVDPYDTIDGHDIVRNAETPDPYDTWNRTPDPS